MAADPTDGTALFWHRRDLRAADNRGLAAAARDGPVVPAFVLDPAVLDHAGPPRVAFLLDALSSLRAWYRERGADLLVARGDPREELPRLAADHGADRVVWNRDYSGLARERDADVAAALADAGFDTDARHDALCHEPGSITTAAGDTYAVFSYFYRKWRDRDKESPVPAPAPGDLADAAGGGPLPEPPDLGFDPAADVPAAGTAAARARLADFCAGDVYRYADARDYPAERATSRLSPHLKFGTVGPRAVWAATGRAARAAPDDAARESVEAFRRQLAWREFYAHVLADRPDVVAANYRPFDGGMDWRDDPEGVQAWKDGRTGFPFVDAGMRQLRAAAWMHNRARMVVASFLTKDLLVDWRVGYDWFRERLVDHDPASDSGGWQWAAGTGTDAQPYFRVFNPVTQGERYDPDGEYVRRHVPELGDATADQIHGWGDLDPAERERVAPAYPAPVVDHAERRAAAIEAFERARGS